jgi:hypothetical protein
MVKRFIEKRALFLCAFMLTLLVVVPAAWAVGWTNVGPAGVHLNDQQFKDVVTANPVYSSQMRLYVTTHSPCGGNNFWMEYLYPDLSLYAISSFREICTAAETPSNWGTAGGNKYAACGELNNEPTNPASTCQRYSTT